MMRTRRRGVLPVAVCACIVLMMAALTWVPALASGPCVLALTPASQTVNVGDTFTVNVVLQPNGQQVFGFDAFVDFDPAYLQVTGLAGAEGSPFNLELRRSFDNGLGNADYSAGTLGSAPTTGSIIVATINFKAVSAATGSAIMFSSDEPRRTNVAFAGESVLKDALGASVVINGTQPAAAFSADVTTGVRPLTVNFTDRSIGGPTAWAWTFGDGGTSNVQNPSHFYAVSGTYDVELTVTVGGVQYSVARNGYVTVMEPTPTFPPTATATASPTIGPTPTSRPSSTTTPPTAAPTAAPPTPTPSPTPVPGAGGNNFSVLLPWLAIAGGGALLAGGIALRRRGHRRT